MTGWLEHHMLPCAFRQLFGFNCPICGAQRALILLLKGDVAGSSTMYPPLPFILAVTAFAVWNLFDKRPLARRWLLALSRCTLVVIAANYAVELFAAGI